jgi:hypothetical protein
MTTPRPASVPTPSDRDRILRLIETFRSDGGFDTGPVDPDAAQRFIAETDAEWHAHRDSA